MSAPHAAARTTSAIPSLFAAALAAGLAAPVRADEGNPAASDGDDTPAASDHEDTSAASGDDATSAADRLFEEAAALMAEGDWQKACPKFRASWRLDPARGTLLGIAQCHEKAGELASAWKTYQSLRERAAEAGDSRREAIAEGRIAALEPRLPRLEIHVAAGVDAEAIAIRRDDVEIDADAIGEARPVDPGTYTIRVERAGAETWSQHIALDEGESKAVVIPPLEPEAPASDGATDAAESSEEGEGAPPRASDTRVSGRRDLPTRYARDGNLAQRWIGYSAVSGGILSTTAGLAFTVRTIRKDRRYREACPEDACDPDDPDIAALQAERDAAQTLATGFVGVGLVAITGGIVLWATAPTPDEGPGDSAGVRVAPLIAPRSLGASLRATF